MSEWQLISNSHTRKQVWCVDKQLNFLQFANSLVQSHKAIKMSEGSDQFVVDNKPSESENTIPPFYRNPVQEPFGSDGRPFYQNNRQGFGYRRDGFQNRGRGFNRGNFRGNNHNNRWQNRNQGDHNQHRGEGRRQNHNVINSTNYSCSLNQCNLTNTIF